jgi:hypothetical protein
MILELIILCCCICPIFILIISLMYSMSNPLNLDINQLPISNDYKIQILNFCNQNKFNYFTQQNVSSNNVSSK